MIVRFRDLVSVFVIEQLRLSATRSSRFDLTPIGPSQDATQPLKRLRSIALTGSSFCILQQAVLEGVDAIARFASRASRMPFLLPQQFAGVCLAGCFLESMLQGGSDRPGEGRLALATILELGQ